VQASDAVDKCSDAAPQTSVYSAYDAAGSLIYVGISGNWGRRWAQHAERSEFFRLVVRLEIENLPSRAEALVREADLIAQRSPRFNVRGGHTPPASCGPVGEPPGDGFVGLFFHSINTGGEVEWQGRITRELPGEHYLVQLYDWMMGDPSLKRIVPLSDMTAWRFYDSADEWRHWYEHVYSPRQRNGIPR